MEQTQYSELATLPQRILRVIERKRVLSYEELVSELPTNSEKESALAIQSLLEEYPLEQFQRLEVKGSRMIWRAYFRKAD